QANMWNSGTCGTVEHVEAIRYLLYSIGSPVLVLWRAVVNYLHYLTTYMSTQPWTERGGIRPWVPDPPPPPNRGHLGIHPGRMWGDGSIIGGLVLRFVRTDTYVCTYDTWSRYPLLGWEIDSSSRNVTLLGSVQPTHPPAGATREKGRDCLLVAGTPREHCSTAPAYPSVCWLVAGNRIHSVALESDRYRTSSTLWISLRASRPPGRCSRRPYVQVLLC
ncbi:hypothetical protein BZA05DRAFT_400837, partial [Tricharina praecox]|uniref:uncharacterized protein n=1 Tax=Tricharina praecox TaxID=43433 RepID=UPI00221E7A1E